MTKPWEPGYICLVEPEHVGAAIRECVIEIARLRKIEAAAKELYQEEQNGYMHPFWKAFNTLVEELKESEMSFSEWKKRSKLVPDSWHGKPITDIDLALQAAYKAGERQGRKDVERIAQNAIALREKLK